MRGTLLAALLCTGLLPRDASAFLPVGFLSPHVPRVHSAAQRSATFTGSRFAGPGLDQRCMFALAPPPPAELQRGALCMAAARGGGGSRGGARGAARGGAAKTRGGGTSRGGGTARGGGPSARGGHSPRGPNKLGKRGARGARGGGREEEEEEEVDHRPAARPVGKRVTEMERVFFPPSWHNLDLKPARGGYALS